MKKVAALLVLALASFALVACGSSSDSSESTATTTETSAESTGAGGASGSESSGGSVVKIEAAEGSELAYTTTAAKAKAGQVSIDFTNPQSLSHDVAIEGSSGQMLGQTELVAESSATTTIKNLKPGEYTFYCTVPGHREAGMEGTLTVE
jgi:plastocyanin